MAIYEIKPGRFSGRAALPCFTVAVVLLLAGCNEEPPATTAPRSCTEVGCESQVTFISPRFAALMDTHASLTVEACLDNQCTQGVVPTGRCQGTGDPQVVSGLGCRPDAIIFHLGPSQKDLTESNRHTASLTIIAQDRTILLLEEFEDISFTRVQPNGPNCLPICYQADIRLPA